MEKQTVKTPIIYAFKRGPLGQHPNTNRGAAKVNFVTAEAAGSCAETNFTSLHGALMLIAWMLLAPIGIYYARYCLCTLLPLWYLEHGSGSIQVVGGGRIKVSLDLLKT